MWCARRYSIGGLSADRVRVLLHPMPRAKMPCKTPQSTIADSLPPTSRPVGNSVDNTCKPEKPVDAQMQSMLTDYNGSDDVVLWEARDVTLGDWREGQIVYAYNNPHAVSLPFCSS